MNYPSFYTTSQQYYSFATDPIDEFLQLRNQAAKAPSPGNFQRTPLPHPPPNASSEKVTGLVTQYADNFKKAITTPSANNPQINGTGATVLKQASDTASKIGPTICNFLNLPGDTCQYVPYVMLGVGALIVFAALKFVL